MALLVHAIAIMRSFRCTVDMRRETQLIRDSTSSTPGGLPSTLESSASQASLHTVDPQPHRGLAVSPLSSGTAIANLGLETVIGTVPITTDTKIAVLKLSSSVQKLLL